MGTARVNWLDLGCHESKCLLERGWEGANAWAILDALCFQESGESGQAGSGGLRLVLLLRELLPTTAAGTLGGSFGC